MRVHPKNQVDPVLVTEEETARLLSVDHSIVKQLIATGELPVKYLGGQRLIPYRDILVLAGVARWKFQEIVEI
ncbi:MAG: helix-turn-helix domain-containing protein [Terriglobales bacterium]